MTSTSVENGSTTTVFFPFFLPALAVELNSARPVEC